MLTTEFKLRKIIRNILIEMSNPPRMEVVGSHKKMKEMSSFEQSTKFMHLVELCKEWGETMFEPEDVDYYDNYGIASKMKGTKLSSQHKEIQEEAQRIANQLLLRSPSYKDNNFEQLVEDIEYQLDSESGLSHVEAVIHDLSYSSPEEWYGLDSEEAKDIRQKEIDLYSDDLNPNVFTIGNKK